MKLLFIILTIFSASSLDSKSATPKQLPAKMYIVPVESNNEFNKAIGKQLKFSNLITQELDTLRPKLQPYK